MQNRLISLFVMSAISIVAFGTVLSSCANAKDEIRTWGDAKGKNKIKAKFVKLEDDVVTLENEDGEDIEIELKKLSASDQKYALEASKESDDNPFKSKSDTPFKPKGKGTTPSETPNEPDREPARFRTLKADDSTAERVLLGAAGNTWRIEVPAIEVRPGTAKPKLISIPASKVEHETMVGFALSRGTSAKVAVVGFVVDPNGADPKSRVVLCDLTTGKAGTPAFSSSKMSPIALHDDGRQILMRREDQGVSHDRLEVWTLKGKEVIKSFAWHPYGPVGDVIWAEFLDK